MGLKPCPRTAVLVQEAVKTASTSAGYTDEERDQLAEFSDTIDHYLMSATL